ncbi:MAG: glutathione S-transferase family protein [Marinomonas sp.]
MKLTLYSGTRNASSWAMRAWLSLKETNIEFEEIIVDIKRPQRWRNIAEISTFSPASRVPVLVVEEAISQNNNKHVIYDSQAIMEFVNELSNNQLLPDDTFVRAEARSMLAWQHADMGKICPSLSFESSFYPDKKILSADNVKSAEGLYQVWEGLLSKYQGPYLFGNVSLADLTLVPSVLRLTSHLEPSHHFPLTKAWAERLLNRPHVKTWLDEAYKLDPIYYDSYLH